jgi:3-hydroxyacyl-CoA dehydrogenase/enoyl-CoA hydratase/3-hydroxybutyryl-CoA epimerase
MQHWTLARDADGIAWLTFDKAGATANTLSAAVLAELNTALDILDQEPPKGLVIRSGKANGFIAGADVEEFGDVHDDADALAIVKRGWDTFERLAKVAYPTLALVRGFCLGGGFELALACRYRVVVDEPGSCRRGAASSACRSSSARRPRLTSCSRARRSTRAAPGSWGSPTSASRCES